MQCLCCMSLQHATILSVDSPLNSNNKHRCSTRKMTQLTTRKVTPVHLLIRDYKHPKWWRVKGRFWIQFQKRFAVVATMLNSRSHSNKLLTRLHPHSTLINPMVVQVLKKCDNWERRTGYFHQKKKVKTEFIYLDDAGNDKLLHWLLLSLWRVD